MLDIVFAGLAGLVLAVLLSRPPKQRRATPPPEELTLAADLGEKSEQTPRKISKKWD